MNEQLHPLTLAEILDRTAQLYRSRFMVFLGIGTIPAGTIFVFAAGTFAFFSWMGLNARHGATVADALVWGFLILLVVLAIPVGLTVSALGEAAMSEAAARLFLGDNITIRNAYKAAWKRGWRYVALFSLQGLVIVGGPAIVFLIAVIAMIAGKIKGVATNDESPLFAGLLILLLLALSVFAVWMLLRLCLAFPASVVEQSPAWSALKRGIMLSHGTRGRIFLLYVLGVFLSQILAWCVTFPVLIAMAFLPGLQGQAHAQALGMVAMFVTYGAFFAVKALIKPIYGIALTVFYFDQRIRKEGFDIEWMMQRAGMFEVPAATRQFAEVVPSLPPQETPLAQPRIEITGQHDADEVISTHQAASENAHGTEINERSVPASGL
ncbi:MAG: hypothetical protein WBQ95_12295 [Terracidiphilus sp.]